MLERSYLNLAHLSGRAKVVIIELETCQDRSIDWTALPLVAEPEIY